jgi:hypothetical protein
MRDQAALPMELKPDGMLGKMRSEAGETPIPGAVWYVGQEVGDGLSYRLPMGVLAGARYLAADLLVEGNRAVALSFQLREGEGGPCFILNFSALNQCQARMRAPLAAVDQNRWGLEREGAWLKPRCGGDRVDLARVDRMALTILRKDDRPARFCLTAITATAEAPAKLTRPILPEGVLMDELGQSALHDWPGKSRSREEVTERLKGQAAAAGGHRFPESYSRWGGCRELRFEPTGFFRTFHDGRRWWLVDPDGYAFWSAGMDCVRVDTEACYEGLESALAWLPERGEYGEAYQGERRDLPCVKYLAANFIRAFGRDWYGKWSAIALGELRRLGFNTVANWSDWQIAREAGFPYVRPLGRSQQARARRVFRDFPDVFDPGFEQEAAGDLAEFSTVMVEKLFTGLSEACKRVDPEHLNLGARYYTRPPQWALPGMRCFDVFSVNGYGQGPRRDLEELSGYVQRPVMIGEYHFGALDVGLPGSGIGHVRDQKGRGQAYRVYLEEAAAKPWCVGAHWFTLYDQSALGRFDGENWNIGFLDVCNRPYEEIGAAARASHERLYQVAQGEVKPYDDAPEYLPWLYF